MVSTVFHISKSKDIFKWATAKTLYHLLSFRMNSCNCCGHPNMPCSNHNFVCAWWQSNCQKNGQTARATHAQNRFTSWSSSGIPICKTDSPPLDVEQQQWSQLGETNEEWENLLFSSCCWKNLVVWPRMTKRRLWGKMDGSILLIRFKLARGSCIQQFCSIFSHFWCHCYGIIWQIRSS